MSARVFTPENRLAKVLASLEGKTEAELVGAAEARVARLEAVIRDYVKEKLARLLDYARIGEEALFAECRDLGAQANDIAEVASAAGLTAIGEVARGIGAMVDSLIRRGVWHTDALRLHLDALVLLNQRSGANDADDAIMLERLRGMRSAIGVLE
jgi:hypothetical protein